MKFSKTAYAVVVAASFVQTVLGTGMVSSKKLQEDVKEPEYASEFDCVPFWLLQLMFICKGC